MKKNTQAIHLPYRRRDAYDALSMPVYNAVAYEFSDAQTMADAFCERIDAPDYSRCENPTVDNFEDRVRALTDAFSVTALNSGMASISNIMLALTAQGKNVVSSTHMFGNTFDLLNRSLRKFGVGLHTTDLTDIEKVKQAVDENTCCIFVEIITNPQMEVADLQALARVAHAHHIPLVADTTTIPFTMFSAGSLGVDIEVVSSTKYISGGATSLGGLVIDYGTTYTEGFTQTLKSELLFNFGAYMTPQAAFLQTMGLETLDARYRVQSSNALELAKKLQTLKQIKFVNYVGLEDNKYHALAQKQFGKRAGAMVCIDLESQDACFNFLNRLKLVHRATNLFDNRTLAIHPYSTIFGNFTPEEKAKMDVLDTTIRLSVGLEDVDDIFEDIKQALQ
jgi:O-acetylhomoserine (thiol)-lyase